MGIYCKSSCFLCNTYLCKDQDLVRGENLPYWVWFFTLEHTGVAGWSDLHMIALV